MYMFDCYSVRLCSIVFNSVRFPNVALCSVGKNLGWVRLSSITERNRSQSNDWSSIGSDYRKFDWLRRVLITTLQPRRCGIFFLIMPASILLSFSLHTKRPAFIFRFIWAKENWRCWHTEATDSAHRETLLIGLKGNVPQKIGVSNFLS